MHLKQLTKRKYAMLLLVLVHIPGSILYAQVQDEQLNQLKSVIGYTVMKECHLTSLSARDYITINKDTVKIDVDFDNATLRTFWTPEVAVQYIYDAALSPLIHAMWDEKSSYIKTVKVLVFNVTIRPLKQPPYLHFEIKQQVWKDFMKSRDKILFYRNIKITSNKLPYHFDAEEAVGIE